MYSIRRLTSVVAILCILLLVYLAFGFSNFERQYARSRANAFSERAAKVSTHKKPLPIMPSNILEPELLHDRVRRIVQTIKVDRESTTLGASQVGSLNINETVERLLRNYEKDVADLEFTENPWEIAESWINPTSHIVPPESAKFGHVLRKLSTTPIVEADVADKGTQLKLKLTFEGGQQVLFKPMFYSRDHIVEGGPFAGADRHNGEIAAFHIGRLLGFHRTPLVAGRKFNIKELKEKSTNVLNNTFYKDGDEWCFYGKCHYCKRETGVCARSGVLEGAVVLLLPNRFALQLHRSPWQRTYRKGVYAKWETDPQYCKKIRFMPEFSGRRILDLIDNSILDFLIQNADRHHFETVRGYRGSIVLLLDNGKSFGDPRTDEFSILAPLYQCCLLRNSTYSQLVLLMDRLGGSVNRVTRNDPLYPLLTNDHLTALDRRLRLVIATVLYCKKLGALEFAQESGRNQ